MKIAFYSGSLSCGGAERVICNLAEFFFAKGHEVMIVTKLCAAVEYPVPAGVKRILADITKEEETTSRVRNLFRRINKLRNIWKEEKPDIIISFIGKNNYMAIVSSLFLKSKVVVSVRSAPEREYKSKRDRQLAFHLFKLADGVILQTHKAFEFFPESIQKRAVILANPLSQEFVGGVYRGERAKEVVTVGRIDSNKNQIMLVKAFERIAASFPEWLCLLYGDGDGAEKVKKYIEDNGLENRIRLMGRVENVREKIEQSAIFVLPSKVEGMPNALIEAMALGMAVISTDCAGGGPAELIQDGENGLLIKVDDEQALTEALLSLMTNEEKRVDMGNAAAQIQIRLAPDKVKEEWLKYIKNVLGENA